MLKNFNLFEIEAFCNILNVFTVTFDQFNASILRKNKIDYKLLNGRVHKLPLAFNLYVLLGTSSNTKRIAKHPWTFVQTDNK